MERDPVPERTNAGGRPTPLSPDTLRAARRLFEQRDMTVAQIGEVLGVSRSMIYRALRGQGYRF
ncbi:helix-turn-helix domain-containing protein, partial [Arthrobacter sp. HMSC06H05]|uniref:helix-turn-helix domain-containing protein n=1 Tax=Arthrobacter sp. HMSC06H05 TaxID=1581128 RepID=UPI002109E51F